MSSSETRRCANSSGEVHERRQRQDRVLTVAMVLGLILMTTDRTASSLVFAIIVTIAFRAAWLRNRREA